MDTFPARLKAARSEKALSQVELARLVGVDPIVISRYERGKIEPRIERVRALSLALEKSIDWLLVREPLGPPHPLPAAS